MIEQESEFRIQNSEFRSQEPGARSQEWASQLQMIDFLGDDVAGEANP